MASPTDRSCSRLRIRFTDSVERGPRLFLSVEEEDQVGCRRDAGLAKGPEHRLIVPRRARVDPPLGIDRLAFLRERPGLPAGLLLALAEVPLAAQQSGPEVARAFREANDVSRYPSVS